MSTQRPRPVRAGVIGPSGIGRVHIDALRRIGVEVSAVAASSPKRAQAIAADLRVPAACTDAVELVGRSDVDVVHVCTPNSLHAEQVRAALDAHKHVVCEKPLSISSETAQELLEAAQEKDLVHAVAYNYRFYPMLQAMRAAVAAGRFGRIHLIQGSYLLDEILLIDDPANWMLDPDRMGSALALADVGVHWWDLVEHVTGQRVRSVVCSKQAARAPEAIGEDSAALILRLNNGAAAVAAISDSAPGHGNTIDLEVIGTEASACWRQEDPDRLWFSPLDQPTELTMRPTQPEGVELPDTLQVPPGQPQGYLDGFRDLLAAIYANIEGHPGPTYPTFADGVRGIKILEALVASADSEGWVNVEP